jgi:hypothetical protein
MTLRLNRTGYMLLAVFFFGGLAMFLAELFLIDAMWVLFTIGGFWMLGAVIAIAFAIREWRRARHKQWLFETGLRAKGTLVEASSHVAINEQPLVKMVLDLQVPGQDDRRVTVETLVNDFAAHHLRKGLVLPVYVNPREPDDLLVVW